MSSYHSSFTYLDKNSKTDFNWIISAFDPDSGEMDSFLSQEQVYADSYRGTKRKLYGTRYDAVALVKISVIKCNGEDFSVEECRKAYRWLTGNPQASWLDLYSGDVLQYSFLGTVQDVKPYKLDARTVGLTIYFESISPWAYSPIQYTSHAFDQSVSMDSEILYAENSTFNVDENGVLYSNDTLNFSDDGTVYIYNYPTLKINNKTDDLYTYVYLNTIFRNNNSDYLSIKNITTGEETIIKNMIVNEIVTLSAEQFIISDVPNKVFGNDFNFVWPRMVPGVNEFVISGSGSGSVEFTYRYPIKIGDCAIDVNTYSDNDCDCPESGASGSCYVDEQDLLIMLDETLV